MLEQTVLDRQKGPPVNRKWPISSRDRPIPSVPSVPSIGFDPQILRKTPAFEDKLVQDALREVLEAIYEQDFLDCSYGFRPGRSAHDAVRTLDGIAHRNQVN